ncbi:hypothetical protein COHA_006004 [Chlorella ohadii]|uniref:RNA polymerase Rpb7-like N-terminal domain-containing protein n=1 Tax=Chlorella ohadii TaxID=2649997 RepID=A0AAD5DM86_9CHLO|nr:hypothetical protein COHA_006004 [Chlorella ohadii]
MVFYLVELQKELEVAPRFFGPKLREEIDRRLRQEVRWAVEGTCNGKYGFVLSVLNVIDTGKGLVREGTGSAVFDLKYSCICFKPFKGEVLDVVVTSVNKVFVSNHLIPETFEFNTAHEPCYQTADGEQKIVPGSEVRLRIVGTRVDASDIFAVGSIKEDYLGVISVPM